MSGHIEAACGGPGDVRAPKAVHAIPALEILPALAACCGWRNPAHRVFRANELLKMEMSSQDQPLGETSPDEE